MIDLSEMKGVGPSRLRVLREAGIRSPQDLLYLLPLRYEDHSRLFPCCTKEEGPVMMEGILLESPRVSYHHGISRVSSQLKDQSGSVALSWFNQSWMAKQLQAGSRVRLYGRLQVKNGHRALINARKVTEAGLIPVYRTIPGIPSGVLRKLIRTALEQREDVCPEFLPVETLADLHLLGLSEALRRIHAPENMEELEPARRRMEAEGVLVYLSYTRLLRSRRTAGSPFQIQEDAESQYWNSLSFSPTKAQRRTLHEIAEDLSKPVAMRRLVQGDVGCGKTAVAFGAAVLSWRAGYQTAMMAPTEILAKQHYETARKILDPMGIRSELLTGNTRAAVRRRLLEELREGKIHVLFGTHALISGDVCFHDLRLVITDEQHRFGVHQRTMLEHKAGMTDQIRPHVLVLSATPIPRSLALILCGDLDISVIDELPSGRIPVKTRLVPESKRAQMYAFLKEEAGRGKQAYIVCPQIGEDEEEDEGGETRSAKALFAYLSQHEMKGVPLGLVYGRQKAAEKDAVIQDFLSGRIQVLVSTTVIEVGINNPNATIMVIENADHFGLSQLHQLRGRVGRGSSESWCFLLAEQTSKLQILCETGDGFLISEKDLEQRGPGDLIGTRQSGMMKQVYAFGTGMKLVKELADYLQRISHDPASVDTYQKLKETAWSYFREKDPGEIGIN